ncbi:glycolate oxidase subunit GlcF [Pinisolibacter aquiterrae]|uniref:glycolate oxidase subunit GlcF n=1 Tax=Pinisolibacter aquiterrae TaxID=2815579 RepID=UPI001C3C46CC|nr:glycolate oxidase subunit GlcF [Pinisolibacter aquiterrae]MBV5263618.1 glycolate oxidase subunit GlcF [Pinisolibacter aquiterrae]MCC8235184.1 glycolate oxidase subunit GlcF [Pinisolibacter aquiterrae]
MQTNFLPELLADPDTALAEKILRKCVHCGFCTATCPTFLELGDELDSPRGRIWLIKEMLETGRPADTETVTHLDRCLTCLSCMTTCPSGVDYMHLVDHARAHVAKTHTRAPLDRAYRRLLAAVIPNPTLFRLALIGATLARPFARLMPKAFSALFALAPKSVPRPSWVDAPQTIAATGEKRLRVALLNGCAQTVLDTAINEATVRLLARLGVEVVVAEGMGCCGALEHHMGETDAAHARAAKNIAAWTREIDGAGLDAIVVNTSGCGTTVKDYGHMFRNDPAHAADAARVSGLARDVSEVLATLEIEAALVPGPRPRVAYHSACSMQHGQKITTLPMELLAKAGFETVSIPESHVCCGSAGTYNILQPELAGRLRDRKLAAIASVSPDVIAAGNIGCMTQIGSGTTTPIVHTVELLDWATGGPVPEGLEAFTETKKVLA